MKWENFNRWFNRDFWRTFKNRTFPIHMRQTAADKQAVVRRVYEAVRSARYTPSSPEAEIVMSKGDPTYDMKQAIAIMLEKHSIACDMMDGSDWKNAVGDGKKTLFALPALQEQIVEQEDGKTRWN
jgi:hypothetical protein